MFGKYGVAAWDVVLGAQQLLWRVEPKDFESLGCYAP